VLKISSVLNTIADKKKERGISLSKLFIFVFEKYIVNKYKLLFAKIHCKELSSCLSLQSTRRDERIKTTYFDSFFGISSKLKQQKKEEEEEATSGKV
jgi:hypothetical protein